MFDVAKSGVQFGVFVQAAKWCNFPHRTFRLFCLHLALFTCTELIISTLRSVGKPALCLHWYLHLSALGVTLVGTGCYTCLHWQRVLCVMAGAYAGIGGQARRLLLSVFRAPYTDMSGWRDCGAVCMAQVFCSAGSG